MEANITFGESLVSLLSSGAGLVLVLLLTLAFAATLLLGYSQNARRFIVGIVPFVQPRDDKGRPVKRSPAQWVGMVLLIGFVLVVLTL